MANNQDMNVQQQHYAVNTCDYNQPNQSQYNVPNQSVDNPTYQPNYQPNHQATNYGTNQQQPYDVYGQQTANNYNNMNYNNNPSYENCPPPPYSVNNPNQQPANTLHANNEWSNYNYSNCLYAPPVNRASQNSPYSDYRGRRPIHQSSSRRPRFRMLRHRGRGNYHSNGMNNNNGVPINTSALPNQNNPRGRGQWKNSRGKGWPLAQRGRRGHY